MNKPSKKQLLDRLNHLEAGLNDLVSTLAAHEDTTAMQEVQDLLATAPSLEPVVKTYKEAIIEELGESALTGVYDNVVDPEAPATE